MTFINININVNIFFININFKIKFCELITESINIKWSSDQVTNNDKVVLQSSFSLKMSSSKEHELIPSIILIELSLLWISVDVLS